MASFWLFAYGDDDGAEVALYGEVAPPPPKLLLLLSCCCW